MRRKPGRLRIQSLDRLLSLVYDDSVRQVSFYPAHSFSLKMLVFVTNNNASFFEELPIFNAAVGLASIYCPIEPFTKSCSERHLDTYRAIRPIPCSSNQAEVWDP